MLSSGGEGLDSEQFDYDVEALMGTITTGWWCRVTVEKDMHRLWTLKAMSVSLWHRVTVVGKDSGIQWFMETISATLHQSGTTTSTDLVTDGRLIPSIPLGMSYSSEDHLLSFHGFDNMLKYTVVVHFYGLQVLIPALARWRTSFQ